MFKKFKLTIIMLTVVLGLQGLVIVPVMAQSNSDAVCEGVALTGADCTSTSGPSVESTIALVVNILSVVVGVVAVIMIIVGGLKYITSGGDSNGISSAKNTILYAIIGLVIVALAQVIVKFVLNKVK